jgi:uncharacterized membrane protein YhaH (DUF805 family)
MFCKSCGQELQVGARFCTKCGAQVVIEQVNTPVQQPYQQPVQKTYQAVKEPLQDPKQSYQTPNILAEGSLRKNGWQHFISALKKIVVFRGRAQRAEFWWFILFLNISFFVIYGISLVVWIFLTIMNLINSSQETLNFYVVGIAILMGIVWLLPLSVLWRRMHDVNKPGVFFLIPYYGIILCFFPGTAGPNRFGPDPKTNSLQEQS